MTPFTPFSAPESFASILERHAHALYHTGFCNLSASKQTRVYFTALNLADQLPLPLDRRSLTRFRPSEDIL